MQTENAATVRWELSFRILSEIPDPVLVTDSERHVIYWNGAAERLYARGAQDILGRRLEVCCPDLWIPGQHLLEACLAAGERRSGEIVVRGPRDEEIFLECSVSLLNDDHRPDNVLWIQHDVTDRKKLQIELQHCHELLHDLPRPGQTAPAQPETAGASPNVVLWAEDDDSDVLLMSRAWQKAEVDEQLVRVRDGVEALQYLRGEGIYQVRSHFPLPSMLLLDIKMPHLSGLDVIHWLQTQPRFKYLPVVLLTSSSAPTDIHEAARLGVKGYLMKPVNMTDWVCKVKTLTSQCK